ATPAAPAAAATASSVPARSAGGTRTSIKVPSGAPGQRPNHAGGSGATSPPASAAVSAARAATPLAVPSSSAATDTAPAPAGRSTSTALTATWLASSAVTHRYAAAGSGRLAVTQARAGGTGCSRRVAETITPSVP